MKNIIRIFKVLAVILVFYIIYHQITVRFDERMARSDVKKYIAKNHNEFAKLKSYIDNRYGTDSIKNMPIDSCIFVFNNKTRYEKYAFYRKGRKSRYFMFDNYIDTIINKLECYEVSYNIKDSSIYLMLYADFRFSNRFHTDIYSSKNETDSTNYIGHGYFVNMQRLDGSP